MIKKGLYLRINEIMMSTSLATGEVKSGTWSTRRPVRLWWSQTGPPVPVLINFRILPARPPTRRLCPAWPNSSLQRTPRSQFRSATMTVACCQNWDRLSFRKPECSILYWWKSFQLGFKSTDFCLLRNCFSIIKKQIRFIYTMFFFWKN